MATAMITRTVLTLLGCALAAASASAETRYVRAGRLIDTEKGIVLG